MASVDQSPEPLKKEPHISSAENGEAVTQATPLESSLPGEDTDAHADIDTDTALQDALMTSQLPEHQDAALATDEAQAEAASGSQAVAQRQRMLAILLVLALVALAALVYWTVSRTDQAALQVGATGQSLMQSQRLAKSVSQAFVGNASAFAEVKESSAALGANIRGLQIGSASVPALTGSYVDDIARIVSHVESAEKNAAVVMEQQQTLTQVGTSLRLVSQESAHLLEIADAISSLKFKNDTPPAEMAAASELVMLTQRIGKSANEFLSLEGVRPEAVLLLSKDLTLFKDTAEGLLQGSQELKLTPARDAPTREQLTALLKEYEVTHKQVEGILGNLQGLVAAREAQAAIIADSEPLRKELEALQSHLAGSAKLNWGELLLLLLPVLVALLAAIGLARVQIRESRQRQTLAEQQRHAAERQQFEAKRVNDANQAAILRLMNELQSVAEGDLTQEATVTEDITGAIADSVNYTVEELRSLVGSVQSTATRVAQTTTKVETTSTELLASSTQQLSQIRATGQSVLDMAARINDVSAQAQESASVARQSLQATESGLTAVQNTIGGMNTIRDQIQETSKRIKRLGESSQEIGEITELIADITEQTNVLALNAAIQAASAGEAGRGFSVVAEEVQRLAERSGDATRQIAALVKAIQTDTQDAVAAMERSTQGVIEGARLSDNAGTALTEIDRVSRRLADLIEQISTSASKEADQANEVAGNIQHIFAVTEQTGEGTRTTASQVRDLARMADELRQSVARFKIA